MVRPALRAHLVASTRCCAAATRPQQRGAPKKRGRQRCATSFITPLRRGLEAARAAALLRLATHVWSLPQSSSGAWRRRGALSSSIVQSRTGSSLWRAHRWLGCKSADAAKVRSRPGRVVVHPRAVLRHCRCKLDRQQDACNAAKGGLATRRRSRCSPHFSLRPVRCPGGRRHRWLPQQFCSIWSTHQTREQLAPRRASSSAPHAAPRALPAARARCSWI